MTALRQIVVFLIISSALGFLTYLIHPDAPNWESAGEWEISVSDALASDIAVIWLDARSEHDYGLGHIPGAISLNEDNWDDNFEGFLDRWNPELRVVVYCDSAACGKSENIARDLREAYGIAESYVLKGGWDSWLRNH